MHKVPPRHRYIGKNACTIETKYVASYEEASNHGNYHMAPRRKEKGHFAERNPGRGEDRVATTQLHWRM